MKNKRSSRLSLMSHPLRFFAAVAPFVFFGTLLVTRAWHPASLYFDELYYVPAAKQLILFKANLNSAHPPLGKVIFGLVWLVFTKLLGLLSEPFVFRAVSGTFALGVLWCVRRWAIELGFSTLGAELAVWLTGLNFTWFVLGKAAMLEMLWIFFALYGLLCVVQGRLNRGWFTLGLALAVKWSAAPFVLLAIFARRNRGVSGRLQGLCIAVAVYSITFLPLYLIEVGGISTLADLWREQVRIWSELRATTAVPHAYASRVWEWPLLLRPMWLYFEAAAGNTGIWLGGNPVLYWLAFLPSLLILRRGLFFADRAARWILALYWLPLLVWAITPRKTQLFYYFLPSSLWLGLILVWYARTRRVSRFVAIGTVVLCAAAFIYFLPILEGRLVPVDQWVRYMWLKRWI